MPIFAAVDVVIVAVDVVVAITVVVVVDVVIAVIVVVDVFTVDVVIVAVDVVDGITFVVIDGDAFDDVVNCAVSIAVVIVDVDFIVVIWMICPMF